jgi:hypothetical protein
LPALLLPPLLLVPGRSLYNARGRIKLLAVFTTA